MIIYPAIELLNVRPVNLNRGRIEEAQVWHLDPVAVARDHAAAGASWLHVTDFDAIEGRDTNAALIGDLLRTPGLPVQLAGGFRSAERVADWIDRGTARIVIGTLAVLDPEGVRALARRYPDQIVVAIDIWKGRVMTNGWRTASALAPEAVMEAFEEAPLAGFLLTDIDNDVADADAALGLVSGLAGWTRLPVIANGLVHSLDDVSRLKYVRNVAGAVVGRALFRKSFTLEEALAVAQPDPEPTAAFL
jgi:phosphoribosylformimino-5-aminoimidazole carboxamide ribotide isomerase